MKIKTAIVSFMLMLAALPALAQTGGVKGVVMDRDASRPVKDAKVTLFYTEKEMFVYTGEDGRFEFEGIEDGVYDMEVSAAGYLKTRLSVRVSGGEIYDLMNVSLTPDVPMADFMSDDMFADFEVEDESGSGYEDVPSVLSASQDVFDNIASFSFSAMRFLSRGYESGMSDIYINGRGFPQNYNNAVKYLRQAASQGSTEAMMSLASILVAGEKYNKDINFAHVLYNLAAVRGVASAPAKRQALETKMKIDEVLQAQQRAEMFKESPSEMTSYIRQTFGTNIRAFVKP